MAYGVGVQGFSTGSMVLGCRVLVQGYRVWRRGTGFGAGAQGLVQGYRVYGVGVQGFGSVVQGFWCSNIKFMVQDSRA